MTIDRTVDLPSGIGKPGNSDRRVTFKMTEHSVLATDIDEPSAGPPPNYRNHDGGTVSPANRCGLYQVFRKGHLATVQETRNMGKGQFRPPLSSSGDRSCSQIVCLVNGLVRRCSYSYGF